ncbi:hypothetical protein GCM10010170_112820 [Dactylosporangium salmoneum]|uniref:Uncharacterized protein n=1 Tax=Dactylosporangium salmoneum TaxID=53361 RepID=A0ABP5VCA6_9ACTN
MVVVLERSTIGGGSGCRAASAALRVPTTSAAPATHFHAFVFIGGDAMAWEGEAAGTHRG